MSAQGRAPHGAGAFARLRALVADLEPPAGLAPIRLDLGEQRLGLPPAALRAMEAGAAWARYPVLGGEPGLRAAYEGWLARRFGIADAIAAGRIASEPAPGAKQALAVALLLAVGRRRAGGGAPRPAVVLPNPYYPTYMAATELADGAPAAYDSGATDLPRAVALAAERARAPTAAIVLCNPASPSGALVAPETLRAVAREADRRDALLLVDECYVDFGLDRAVDGAAPLLAEGAARRMLVVHSLSKRSGAPGLRSAFVAGDPESVAAYAAANRNCGVSLAAPVAQVSAALWSDDAHVESFRTAAREAWAVADATLASVPGYARPPSGFFLWLPVDDDVAAARVLWREAALSVLPGRFLSTTDQEGHDPGLGRLRIALVHEPNLLREALERLAGVVGRAPPPARHAPPRPLNHPSSARM